MKIADFVNDKDTDANLHEGKIKLARQFKQFTGDMLLDLDGSADQGFHGWDEPENFDAMFERLIDNAKRGEFVDAANFCLFLDRTGYKPKVVK